MVSYSPMLLLLNQLLLLLLLSPSFPFSFSCPSIVAVSAFVVPNGAAGPHGPYSKPRPSIATPDIATVASVTTVSPLAATADADTESTTNNKINKGDPVLLVGPGFLQLVTARHLYKAGLRPIIVASQSQLDSFFKNLLKNSNNSEDGDGILDDEEYNQLLEDSTIGMPEIGDPYFGELKGVVFCAEEAVLPAEFVSRVLDFEDNGESAFDGGRPTRVICTLPVSNKVQKEKSNSWIPIFNNDKKQDQVWEKFTTAFQQHPCMQDNGCGSIVRFGSLFGGSTDGPEQLLDFGLDEGMYKMSLEQYRDMRERAFDRYKLAAQVLMGDTINPKPTNQDANEKSALAQYPPATREAFSILGDYPEQDRSNRHTVAAAIVELLQRPVVDVASKELTVLSKARSELPTPQEWDDLFSNPQPATWPDPAQWKPSEYGLMESTEKEVV